MLVKEVFGALLTAILDAIFNISTFWIKTKFHFNCFYHLASKIHKKSKLKCSLSSLLVIYILGA